MDELTVVIQAGGESKRMGRPKALVPFCGAPLICRGLKRVGGIAAELIITTNDPQSFGFLCEHVTLGKLRLCSDLYEGRSALNGLYTALHFATNPYVAIVACDMIFPSAPILLAELEALMTFGADLAVPRVSHGFEPFHAVYRRETCLPLVRAALEEGNTKATVWYAQAQVIEFDRETMLDIDPRGGTLINVNTRSELDDMQARISEGTMTKADGSPESSPSSWVCDCGFDLA